MIERLPDGDKFQQSAVADKLNELIDAYNLLEEKYDNHYHITRDGSTTGPNIK